MYRILYIGLGPLGRRIIHDLHERQIAEVIAAVDMAPEMKGRTVFDVAGAGSGAVLIVPDLESVSDEVWASVDAAVVTTSSDLRKCADTFRALLKRGLPVISTCEELLWPWLRHRELAEELDALATEHGGRLLGTGINPGFLMDTLPVCLTAVTNSVTRIEAHRIQDATTRRVPFQQKIGAGATPEEFQKRVDEGSLRHVGLGESLYFIASLLRLPVRNWNETIEPVIAKETVKGCALGTIEKGNAVGVRQVAEGTNAEGECILRLVFQATIGESDPHDRVIVEGDPPLDVVLKGGVHGDIATSAMVINSIPRLIEATPGLHTMASIPLIRFAPAGIPVSSPPGCGSV